MPLKVTQRTIRSLMKAKERRRLKLLSNRRLRLDQSVKKWNKKFQALKKDKMKKEKMYEAA